MTPTGPRCVCVTAMSCFQLETSALETIARPGRALQTPISYQVITHTHLHSRIFSSGKSWSLMRNSTLNTHIHTNTHLFYTTHHHMPTAVIQFISKNPVIMKYVTDPSEGLLSGQRSGSATGRHFWGLVSCSRTTECGR